MTAEQLFAELARVDRELTSTPAGDFTAIRTLLAQRAGLLYEILPLVEEEPSPGRRRALERSLSAGMLALRQLIQTRQLIAGEMAAVGREQRLAGSLAAQSPRARRLGVDVQG